MKLRIRISGRSALAVLAPALVIIVGSISLSLQGFQDLIAASRSQSKISMAVAEANLLIEIDRETTQSLLAVGDPRPEPRARLLAQRRATDRVLQSGGLVSRLKPNSTYQRTAMNFDRPIETVIADIRQRVDRGDDMTDWGNRYLALDSVIRNQVKLIAGDTRTSDLNLSHEVWLYDHMLEGYSNEAAIQSTGIFDFKRRTLLLDRDDAYFVFLNATLCIEYQAAMGLAAPDEYARIKNNEYWPYSPQVRHYLEAFRQRIGKSPGVTPDEWFAATNPSLAANAATLKWLSGHLKAASEANTRNALTRLVITLVTLIAALFGAVAVGVWFAQLARRPLQRMVKDVGRLRALAGRA